MELDDALTYKMGKIFGLDEEKLKVEDLFYNNSR